VTGVGFRLLCRHITEVGNSLLLIMLYLNNLLRLILATQTTVSFTRLKHFSPFSLTLVLFVCYLLPILIAIVFVKVLPIFYVHYQLLV
jgi:hypothetical protein